MIEIGKYNTLIAGRETKQGIYLEDDEGNTILLPKKYVPGRLKENDDIRVFVYKDAEHRPIATTLRPKVTLNRIARLELINMNQYGAFFDWGLPKDLFVPYSELFGNHKVGGYYFVYLYLDNKSERLTGSNKIHKFLEREDVELEKGEEVRALMWERVEQGIKVIINHEYQGMIFNSDIFREIKIGETLNAFVKNVREDGKVDVTLQAIGYEQVEPMAQKILKQLQKNDGFLALNDKSNPEKIKATLEMSKKTFKKAIGNLYKQRLIRIEADGIHLI